MIRIAAVDDENHVLERFERMVLGIKELELCGLFETAEQLLSYLNENPLDAVFLDIEMPDINGLQLSDQILDLNENIDIIFVTAFNQYAVEAFEVHAIDYILKPLTEERLCKTVKRLLRNRSMVDRTEKPFIQCIGGFEVFLNGEAMTWKNSKAKEVLAFLVYKEGVPVNWEKVADAIWPDFDPEKAHANFHATTYLLRKRLAEVGMTQIMTSSRGNYRIVTDLIDCDIYRLEAMYKDNKLCKKDNRYLIEQLKQRGYMEGCGYEWSYPRAAELDKICEIMIEDFEENN